MTAAVLTTLSLRRRPFLATAIAALCLTGAACAHADPVDLTVIDRDTGETLRVWRHDGRLFVAGRPGARYSLKVANNTDGRVLVVMSVDGVNILSGETANYDQRGYIFDAHESYAVNGWRKSDTEIAAFTFASLPQSYAARTGRPADVGVIGMAVFNERPAVQETEADENRTWPPTTPTPRGVSRPRPFPRRVPKGLRRRRLPRHRSRRRPGRKPLGRLPPSSPPSGAKTSSARRTARANGR